MIWDYVGATILVVVFLAFIIHFKVIRPYLEHKQIEKVRREIKKNRESK